MNRDELNQLRAEARRRHKAATRKASRLRQQGIEVTGSKVDPRRNLAALKRYNAAQLRSYIGQLDTFTSRKTQFVGSSKREPISRTKWKKFESLQDMIIANAEARMAPYADMKYPGSDTTIAGRFEVVKIARPRMGDPQSTVNPSKFTRLSADQLADEKALDKLMKSARKRAKSGYIDDLVAKGRVSARRMAEESGNDWLAGELDKLNDRQFEVLWHYTALADQMKLEYEGMRAMADANMDGAESSIARDQRKRSQSLVNWAKKL